MRPFKNLHLVFTALIAPILLGTPRQAAAQAFPAQPIRAVVGYAAGGGADGLIRAMSNELGEALGQPIIIDNRGGGGTVQIGRAHV